MKDHQAELERIREAYRQRDAGGAPTRSPWLEPVFRLHRREMERAVLEEIANAGVGLAGARVLEVGCGSGELLSRFLDYGAGQASGIDLMEDRIATANRRYPSLELMVGDASRLPWQDESFDLVTQFTCLSSVLDSALRRAVAAEMWRVLAPGGLLLSYDMRPPALPIRALRLLVRAYRRTSPPQRKTPVSPLSAVELRSWFPGARLRSVGLDSDVARHACRVRAVEQLALAVPWLRVHTLAVAQKPQSAATRAR
ncbi:MAG: class I SAM-dependent methyltransferase [Solirubrobacteraceae bacterium]